MRELTFFYDGDCPLCKREVDHLRACDTGHRIDFVDINSARFADWAHQVDYRDAYRFLTAVRGDGSVLKGLDANYEVWKLVGRGFWFGLLRKPVVRWLADGVYWLFARFRPWFSGGSWTNPSPRCAPDGSCRTDGNPDR